MRFVIKLLLANLLIVGCVQLGRRFPSLSGLIATMPITTLIVLLWLADDMPGNQQILADYSRGVFWGIGPTLLFFSAATYCFRRQMSLPVTISISFACWFLGALMHQWLVK